MKGTIGGLPALIYGDIATAKSVVLIFAGIGEKGSDLSALLKVEFIQKFEAGQIPANRLIVIPQLPSSQPGWYQNIMTPIMNDIASKYSLPVDGGGYSLGGIAICDAVADKNYGPIFRSAMSACGKDDPGNANCYPAFRKIPSIHYYDPADTTVAYGYQNISAMVSQLQSEGKKDISLVTLKGNPTPHSIWNQVYEGLYWDWLNTIDGTVAPPAPKTHIYINNVDLGEWTAPISSIQVK